MKGKKPMIILAGVLVVLAVVYFALTAWNDKQEEKQAQETEDAKIYLNDEEELTAFSYTDSENEMHFVKDEEWYLTEEPDVALEQSSVETIAAAIANCEATRKLEEPDDLSEYGFDEPSYQISYENAAGEEVTIRIGAASGEDYYANMEGEETVYTISTTLIESLLFDISEFAKLDSVPSIGSENLQSVEVIQGDETTVYEEETDLSSLSGGFGALTLTEVADYAADDSEKETYGLSEETRKTVKAVYTDSSTEEEETFTVYIGDVDDSVSYRYLQVEGSDIVYLVEISVVENITEVQETEE